MSKPKRSVFKPGGVDFVAPRLGVIGVVRETELAARLGLPQVRLRGLRKSLREPGLDWFHEGVGKNCRVVWTDSGLKQIEKALNVTVSRAVPEGEEMVVVRSGFRNPRIIQCRRSCGLIVNVRVKDSANYRPVTHNGKPMQVRAQPTGEGWVVLGRSPRFPGRW